MSMREIKLTVTGETVWKNTQVAGVQGSGNVSDIRVTFDERWDGFAKKLTLWNANGLNPVEQTLTVNFLADAAADTRTYLVPIPPEPMEIAGFCMLVIDGYTAKNLTAGSAQLSIKTAIAASTKEVTVNEAITAADASALPGRKVKIGSTVYTIGSAAAGASLAAVITLTEPISLAAANDAVIAADGKRARSVSVPLEVVEAPRAETASEAADPTPTQAEQLQVQIDGILGTISHAMSAKTAAETARDGAVSAKNDAQSAKVLSVAAKDAAVAAKDAAVAAKTAAEAAKTAAESAGSGAVLAKTDAMTAKDAAVSAKTAAETAKSGAEASKTAAETAKTDAAKSAETALTKAGEAAASAASAETAKTNAITAKGAAITAKTGAEAAKAAAESAQKSAAASAAAADASASTAALAKTGAETAQSAAETAKADAIAAKNGAVTAKDTAVTANNDTVTAKTAAERAKTLAETAQTGAQTAAASADAAKTAAQTAKSNAETAASTATAQAAAAAKSAAEAAAAAGGGVTSFNGRGGTVTPQAGDYTAAMVGADASGAAATAKREAISAAEADAAAKANTAKSGAESTAETKLSSHDQNAGTHQNLTIPFTQAASRVDIATGETIAVILGKIKKWFADLGTAAFSAASDFAAAVHTHTKSQITDFPTSMAPTTHSHEQSDVTGLSNALGGKAAATHGHAATDVTSGTLPAARGGTGCATLQAARNAMGLGNTTGALLVANGGTGAITAAAARTNLGAASTVSYTGTLLSTGWTAQAAGYAQTITVTGMLAADDPVADAALTGDVAADKLIIEAWGAVSRITAAANSVTAYAYGDAPTVNVPIKLKVVR